MRNYICFMDNVIENNALQSIIGLINLIREESERKSRAIHQNLESKITSKLYCTHKIFENNFIRIIFAVISKAPTLIIIIII